jgi:hypothetical protein
MATMRKRTETERGHEYQYADMQPVEFRPDGTPTRFEIVTTDDDVRYPPAIGWDDAPIVSPLPEARIVKAQSVVSGSWSDRARAFNISTLNLSIVTGILATIAALVFGASVSFFVLALYFFGGFTLAWLVAYALHTFVSAEGSQMADTLLLWRFLFNEQRHRHQRYNAPKTDSQRTLETVLFALASGFTVLAGLGLLVAIFMENSPK